MAETQMATIKRLLRTGRFIYVQDLVAKYKITRAATYIYTLREEGWTILYYNNPPRYLLEAEPGGEHRIGQETLFEEPAPGMEVVRRS